MKRFLILEFVFLMFCFFISCKNGVKQNILPDNKNDFVSVTFFTEQTNGSITLRYFEDGKQKTETSNTNRKTVKIKKNTQLEFEAAVNDKFIIDNWKQVPNASGEISEDKKKLVIKNILYDVTISVSFKAQNNKQPELESLKINGISITDFSKEIINAGEVEKDVNKVSVEVKTKWDSEVYFMPALDSSKYWKLENFGKNTLKIRVALGSKEKFYTVTINRKAPEKSCNINIAKIFFDETEYPIQFKPRSGTLYDCLFDSVISRNKIVKLLLKTVSDSAEIFVETEENGSFEFKKLETKNPDGYYESELNTSKVITEPNKHNSFNFKIKDGILEADYKFFYDVAEITEPDEDTKIEELYLGINTKLNEARKAVKKEANVYSVDLPHTFAENEDTYIFVFGKNKNAIIDNSLFKKADGKGRLKNFKLPKIGEKSVLSFTVSFGTKKTTYFVTLKVAETPSTEDLNAKINSVTFNSFKGIIDEENKIITCENEFEINSEIITKVNLDSEDASCIVNGGKPVTASASSLKFEIVVNPKAGAAYSVTYGAQLKIKLPGIVKKIKYLFTESYSAEPSELTKESPVTEDNGIKKCIVDFESGKNFYFIPELFGGELQEIHRKNFSGEFIKIGKAYKGVYDINKLFIEGSSIVLRFVLKDGRTEDVAVSWRE